MSDRIEVDRPLIEPVYSQAEPNEPIDLGQTAVRYDHEGTTLDDVANVAMRFVPNDRLEFVVSLEGKHPSFGLKLAFGSDHDKRLNLTDRSVCLDTFIAAVDSNRGVVFSPKQSAVTVTPSTKDISSAKFHLFNFPDFNGPDDYVIKTSETARERSQLCGRAILKADGWVITLAATDRTGDMVEGLREQGGFALTHMGQIAREDGEAFSDKELDEVLSCLNYFLSFVLGRWANVALPIGFDSAGNRVFERWGMGRTAQGRWNGSCSWWRKLHGELLSQVFPGFAALWKDTVWRQPLTRAIYWYLRACAGGSGLGVDTGLILAQTVLETLAWTHCVASGKMVSPKAFGRGGLSAADKFRLLASSMSIPKEIPPNLSTLHGRPGKKWEDSMDAITCVRNSLVHADARTTIPDGSYFAAWKLSLWYIDLVLLHLCGHNGRYANRLALISQLSLVPWARQEDGGK